jgi:hypothetical protein
MSYYCDLLRDYQNRYNKAFYFGLPLYLKFKTKPSDKVTLAQNYKIARSVEAREGKEVVTYATSQETKVEHSCCDEVSCKFTFGNAGESYKVSYKPKQYNNSDLALQAKHVSKFDFSSSRIDNTESVKLGSPNVSGARLWQTFVLSWNTADNQRGIKGSTNINYEKYNLGAKYDYDLTKGQVKSINGQIFVRQAQDTAFWATYDVNDQHASVGAEYRVCDYGTHGFDVVFDTTQKLKGFFGQPLTVNWAGQYQMSEAALFKFKLALQNEWVMGWSWAHRVNKQVKLTFSQNLNISHVLSGSGKNPYDFGAALQWDL